MAFNIAYTYQLIDKYTRPLEKIIASTRAHTRFLKENQNAIRSANSTITRMANRTDRLGGSLRALQSNNVLRGLTDQARGLNEQIDRMGRARLPGMPPGAGGGGAGGSRFGAVTSRFGGMGAAMSGLAGLGIGSGMSNIARQTATIEDAMIDLARATDLPSSELKKFEERFMTLSEKIGISTDKLAIMAYEASKAGIPTAELDRFVKITANSAVAFEVLEEEAGRALGSIKAKTGLSIDGLQELMDRINFVADATSADGARMINIVERLSGTFKMLKVPPEVAAGLAAVADQLETSPELAASGMNMLIRQMMKAPALAEKMIQDPENTIRNVFNRLAKMPQAKQMGIAMKMFGDEAGRFAVKLAGNMSLFEETMQKAADAKAMGSMEREMASKLKSLSMLWRNLKNGVMNVAVAIGEGLAPDIKRFGDYLRDIVPRVRDFVREHPGLVKIAMAGIAILGAFALAAPIVMALGAAFSFVGAAVAVISAPIAAVIALAAGIAMRWGEWSESGHPLVVVINSLASRIGRLVGWVGDLIDRSGTATKVIGAISAAFDFLGVVLAIPLQALDQIIWAIERVIELAGQLTFGKVLEGVGEASKNLLPAPMRLGVAAFEAFRGDSSSSEVNGTITVKAEPGTKARVAQPMLPTGNNVRLAGAQ